MYEVKVKSKHGPRKIPWTSSKKRKKRRTNDYTSIREEAKVGLADEAMRSSIKLAKLKIKSREEKSSVKIWELDIDNSDRCRSDPSVASVRYVTTNRWTHSDPLEIRYDNKVSIIYKKNNGKCSNRRDNSSWKQPYQNLLSTPR